MEVVPSLPLYTTRQLYLLPPRYAAAAALLLARGCLWQSRAGQAPKTALEM